MDTSTFRAEYVRDEPPRWYRGWAHFWLTSCAAVTVIAVCLMRVSNVTWLELLTVPVTLSYANLAEYIGHKGPMHRPFPFLSVIFRHTTVHHRFYTRDHMAYEGARDFHALLLPPSLLVFFFGLFALPVGALLYVVATANVAYLFVASALGYFISYEWLHFCYHAPAGSLLLKIPFLVRLRQHHLVHHDPRLMSRYNFNITVPLVDWLFGTTYREDKIPTR